MSRPLLVLLFALGLGGCGSSSVPADVAADGARVLRVCPGPDATRDALIAFHEAQDGDTIEFCEGRFELGTGLFLHSKRGITIRGAGKDGTVLSFKHGATAEGLSVSHADGVVLQGFTIEDTPGNLIRVYRSKYVTFRDIRAQWTTYKTCNTNPRAENACMRHGAYALYPVESRHVLIEDSEAFGASDAGIYVGQSSDVVVRRTRAEYNVTGFEFENVYRGVFEDNVATNNSGGILVFDLPDLSQYGENNVVRRNRVYANNRENFAPLGNIIGMVPRGTGLLIIAGDQIELYDNDVYDHDTFGLAIVNYGLINPNQPDTKYDFYPEGIHVYGNRFRDNGGRPQEPNLDRGEASVLPLLLRIKNLGRAAHIMWDGALDAPNDCTQVPTDADGVPLTEDNPNESGRYHDRVAARGRPNFQRTDPAPPCRYNAWKFDDEGRLKPENGLYIADDNVFENTRATTLLTTDFVNAKLTTSALPDLALELLRPVSTDLRPHRGSLPPMPLLPLQLPYVHDAGAAPRPDPAAIERACAATRSGAVNFAAARQYDCPRLADYGLFADPQDPHSALVEGLPYELNSELFSDYALKRRSIHLPPGTQMRYRDHRDGVTSTLEFPVGTVITKTFAFEHGGATDTVETRLLIKRAGRDGHVYWTGLPYVWRTDAQGRREARLQVEGAQAAVDYDYADPDEDVDAHYAGHVARYGVPAAVTCMGCHARDDRDAGAAPIGPNVRNLNRDFAYPDGTTMNQLRYLQTHGWLDHLPADPAQLERIPRWKVPGDGGERPGSAADVHQRARAFLEVNCMHCHNANGAASNSGLFLDVFRDVDIHYGICKTPIAAGRGSGDKRRDIIPGDADGSILLYRLAAVDPGVRMPPLARTAVQAEAVQLIRTWIDDALTDVEIEDADICTGGLLGLTAKAAAPPTSHDQRREQARGR